MEVKFDKSGKNNILVPIFEKCMFSGTRFQIFSPKFVVVVSKWIKLLLFALTHFMPLVSFCIS